MRYCGRLFYQLWRNARERCGVLWNRRAGEHRATLIHLLECRFSAAEPRGGWDRCCKCRFRVRSPCIRTILPLQHQNRREGYVRPLGHARAVEPSRCAPLKLQGRFQKCGAAKLHGGNRMLPQEYARMQEVFKPHSFGVSSSKP